MVVRFVLGRSGTGKTYYCMDRIAAELRSGPTGPAMILLVPEQATYQSASGILKHGRIAGFHRLKILSFDRLSQEVLGSNLARRKLSEIGRQMLIQRILLDLSGQMRILAAGPFQTGLAMAEAVSDLYDQAISIDRIQKVVRILQSRLDSWALAAKLADISLVLEEYLRRLQGRFIDPKVELAKILDAIRHCSWLKGARLWVDGFAGFTASELSILQELLQVTSHAEIALCLDPDAIDLNFPPDKGLDQTRTFYPTELTYWTLLKGIRDLEIDLEEPVLLRRQMRFAEGTSLSHLERYIFRQKAKVRSNSSIQIWIAPDRRTEVEAVARYIRRLVQEEGLRYNQIAILCPNLTAYEPYLKAYLARFSIPSFLDMPRPLARHPLSVLLISVMQVLEGGFQTSDVITYMKTGLVPIDAQRLDTLESYCKTFGIGPADWLSHRPWAFDDPNRPRFDQTQIQATQQELIRPLLELKASLQGDVSAADLVAALSGLFNKLDVQATIARWIETARLSGDQSLAQEHQQAAAMVTNILQEMREVFGQMTAGLQQWLLILKAAISKANLALIPPTLDQVLVGTIDRSRHPELEVAFVIGATQDEFPAQLPKKKLLSQSELDAVEEAGLRFGLDTMEALSSWRYLAYVAFTRARKLLVVSHPKQDQNGTAIERSPLVDDLVDLFDDIEQVDVTEISRQQPPQDWYDLIDLTFESGIDRAWLIEAVGDRCPGSIAKWLQDPIGTGVQQVLDKDVIESIFSEGLHTSASRLSAFAKCPFRHFARYILALEPAREPGLRPLELGNLYHRVLHQIVGQHIDSALQGDMESLKDQVQSTVARIVDADPFLSNFASRGRYNRYQIERACRVLTDCITDLVAIYKAGSLRPYLLETGFGSQDDLLGQTRLTLPDGRPILIWGRIDRIDLADDHGRALAIVTDYKTSPQTFNWSGLYHGLDLQLPIYLIAVKSAFDSGLISAEPAGAFYLQVELWPKRQDGPDEEGNYLHRKARGIFDGRYHHLLDLGAKGGSRFYSFYVDKRGQPYGYYLHRDVLKPDHFQAVMAHAKAVVIQLAQQIVAGFISTSPARWGNDVACRDCNYMALCRFEQAFGQYRQLEAIDKQAFIARLGDDHGQR